VDTVALTTPQENNQLFDVVALGPQDVWSVGENRPPVDPGGLAPATTADGSLIEHYGCTTTPCTLPFSDVSAGDWAFGYIQWTFCNHIISGYADGSFRPSNPSTRGQVAKMIVLAAGWPLLTPPTGTFTDVPPGSTFYSYIETGYSHGILTGYADGTYRPSNNVTRGQLTKLVVLARGYTLANPATARFTDVPVGSAFYPYIETAASIGIVGGYSDGTFRPGNSATRAQFSKILFGAYATSANRPTR
jgi:hypothetical protein